MSGQCRLRKPEFDHKKPGGILTEEETLEQIQNQLGKTCDWGQDAANTIAGLQNLMEIIRAGPDPTVCVYNFWFYIKTNRARLRVAENVPRHVWSFFMFWDNKFFGLSLLRNLKFFFRSNLKYELGCQKYYNIKHILPVSSSFKEAPV